MKYLILIVLFTVNSYAQSTAFAVRDNTVQWENVFVTNEAEIATMLEKHPRLKITSHKGNVYKGTARGIKNTCPGTSAVLADTEINFDFEVEKSNGMYRVTVTKIYYKPVDKKKKAFSAESHLTEKGVMKPGSSMDADRGCLDALFSRTFTTTTAILKNKP